MTNHPNRIASVDASADLNSDPDRRRWMRRAGGIGLWLGGGLGGVMQRGLAQAAAVSPELDGVEAALRRGGVVLALRHALAPGSYDPPEFKLGDCSTQRNLDAEGRAQARRIGAWLEARSIRPARVRSSPWCRCVDTAELAFGQAEVWPALGSPVGASETTNAESLQQLDDALRAVSAQLGRVEVWVTHMFVLSAWTDQGASSGEGLLLQSASNGVDAHANANSGTKPRVLGRLKAG